MTNKIGVYIMGAGQGSRLGLDIPKPLVKIGDKTILDQNYGDWNQHDDIPVTVVVGFRGERYPPGYKLISNDVWRTGIKSSYQRVLRDADSYDIDRIIVVDGDIIVSSQAIKDMIELSREGNSSIIVLLVYEEKAGPCIGVGNYTLGFGYEYQEDYNKYERTGYFSQLTERRTGKKWGNIASFDKETFRNIVENNMEDGLLVESFYGECAQIVVEDKFYIGINTPEHLEQAREFFSPKKELKKNNNTFWEKRDINPDDPVESSRLHGGVLGDRRLIHEMLSFKEIMRDVPINRMLDLGCGTGELYPLILEMADHITAIDVNQKFCDHVHNLYSDKVDAYCNDIISIPPFRVLNANYDFVMIGGLLQYFNDVDALKILDLYLIEDMERSTTHVLIRNTTSLKETETTNKHVDRFNDQYFCVYRTMSNILSLVEKSKYNYQLKRVSRVYPDEIESEFGTKQYYLLFEVKF